MTWRPEQVSGGDWKKCSRNQQDDSCGFRVRTKACVSSEPPFDRIRAFLQITTTTSGDVVNNQTFGGRSCGRLRFVLFKFVYTQKLLQIN